MSRGSVSRRDFLRYGAYAGAGLYLVGRVPGGRAAQVVAVAGAEPSLDPASIDQFITPLTIPPAMPRTGQIALRGDRDVDYYEIAVRQFQQQVLPAGRPTTTVWSYGSATVPDTFNYPAFTIEARWQTPVRVKWINDLGSSPHLLPVDPTLHWANPSGPRDSRPSFGETPGPYTGPVPFVTHLHGAEAADWADGYAEAWYLAAGASATHTKGTWYDFFKAKAEAYLASLPYAASPPAAWRTWSPGNAIFQYENDQRAATLWYHDHTLGMTRLNVYAGPAGFYLLRGGPGDDHGGRLPGPAPALGDAPGTRYYEIPLAIQDRSFNEDGSLFYPDARAFFEGLKLPPDEPYLDIPYIGAQACDGESDVSPIWQPEFFGTTMLVNGATWPHLEVEQRRYRFRILNGCNGRFVILQLERGVPFWQIGAEGGFLRRPVRLEQLLMGPAERADVIVDFTDVPVGTRLTLLNLGPDEPFGGGVPGEDFPEADPETTGRVMQFWVVPRVGVDRSTRPDLLRLPARPPLKPASVSRKVSLNEAESETVRVITDEDGNVILACNDPAAVAFGPTEALLGTVDAAGAGIALGWDDEITENPDLDETEVWEIHNFTEDAHPIHVHELQFEVVNREPFDAGPREPEAWETGLKDTVIAYPGEITRIKLHFNHAGQFVWHCHLVEHEDNEMMRPYRVGPAQAGQPE